MSNKQPAISVTLLTYNHAQYIRQCLDGILMQKISFDLEILVGDDCSTDGTQEILREYDANFPGIFTMILREKNLGATKNLYDLLKRAKGKYIAGLEGDDYWTDENKLQIQFDFLESHQEYIGCSHQVHVIDENGRPWCFDGKYIDGRHWSYYQDIYTYNEYQQFILPGQGSSYLYRNVFLNPRYDYSIIETAHVLIGDMTLMLILSAQGDWYFMEDRFMACYRYIIKSGGKNWAGKAHNANTSYEDYMYRCALEEYAETVLKKPLDLSQRKEEILYAAYCRMRFSTSPEDQEIFVKTLAKSGGGHPLLIKLEKKYKEEKLVMPSVVYAIQTEEVARSAKAFEGQTWEAFDRAAMGKTIVAFGGGNSFREFLLKYGNRYSVPIVLDNNPKFNGMTFECWKGQNDVEEGRYEFSEMQTPDCIAQWVPERFVILITSTLYQNEIAEQLDAIGFHDYYSLAVMESSLHLYDRCKKVLHEKTFFQ